jgi:hypothetical protein
MILSVAIQNTDQPSVITGENECLFPRSHIVGKSVVLLLTHSFELSWAWQYSHHTSRSHISVLAAPVSSLRELTMVLMGHPPRIVPCFGSHNTTEEAGSSGCRRACPANLSPLAAILLVTFGSSPYSSPLVMCCCQLMLSTTCSIRV